MEVLRPGVGSPRLCTSFDHWKTWHLPSHGSPLSSIWKHCVKLGAPITATRTAAAENLNADKLKWALTWHKLG